MIWMRCEFGNIKRSEHENKVLTPFVGLTDGLFEGGEDGLIVGLSVVSGDRVGAVDGDCGERVGESECKVGPFVGFLDGDLDGGNIRMVGFAEGESDGGIVGDSIPHDPTSSATFLMSLTLRSSKSLL